MFATHLDSAGGVKSKQNADACQLDTAEKKDRKKRDSIQKTRSRSGLDSVGKFGVHWLRLEHSPVRIIRVALDRGNISCCLFKRGKSIGLRFRRRLWSVFGASVN